MPIAPAPHHNTLTPVVFPILFGAGSDRDSDDAARSWGGGAAAPHEDLPYKVELWDARKSAVEVVLAVTANSSIGYAAYHAATREYPERYVTLRHNNRTVARVNGPEH